MRRLFGIHTGIVLKKYAHKNKIALLDKALGRIDGILFARQEFAIGAQLSYSLDEHLGTYFIVSCEVIDVPLMLGKYDVYFLHHVLEVCYYSVQLGSVDQAVFDIIIFLYKHFSPLWSMAAKKIVIFRLFIAIGYYVDHQLLRKPSIIALCAMPIDKLFGVIIDLDDVLDDVNDIKDMRDWLCECLMEHPYGDQFKTVNFLYKE